jgi:glycosyltransferase involved in cell wall biosynthesis
MKNKISVILPVKNGEKHIRNAIDSILTQTYPHFELVVVDASDDYTPDIVKSHSDSRIKYFRQKSKGSVNGYNEALDSYVTGKYITFIHHDDIYHPEKLYEQVRMIEKFSDVDCVYNDIEFVDENLNRIRVRGHEDYYHRNYDLLAVMMIGYGISNLGMNVLIKRDFIEKHHLRYSLETPVCCDHEYMFSMIDAGAVFKHIDKTLLRYRVHNGNYSGDRDVVEQDNLKIYSRYSLERLREIVGCTNYSEAERCVILGKLHDRLGHSELAVECFKSVLNGDCKGWAAFYLGSLHYGSYGDFENAKKYLSIALEALPFRAEIHNNIGCCFYQLKNYAAAKKEFEIALEFMPNCYDAKTNLELMGSGEIFNPRPIAREIEYPELFGIVWKEAEKKRAESGSLKPART